LFTLAGLVCLTGLGIWQLQRLSWKQDLIAKIELRTLSEQKTFPEIYRLWENKKDVEYYRISVRGIFEHDKEIHFYTVDKSLPGWRIVTPLKMDNGKRIFVDRGFVPLTHKNAETRDSAQFRHPLEISGLVRHFTDTKGLFVPDNDPEKNEWYWKSLIQMAKYSFGEQPVQIAPFFVESDDMGNRGGWPRGGVTRIRLPNRHLEYAITWFALAGTLLIIYLYYMRNRMNE